LPSSTCACPAGARGSRQTVPARQAGPAPQVRSREAWGNRLRRPARRGRNAWPPAWGAWTWDSATAIWRGGVPAPSPPGAARSPGRRARWPSRAGAPCFTGWCRRTWPAVSAPGAGRGRCWRWSRCWSRG